MPYEIVVHNGRQNARHYDKGAIKIKHKDGLGCVFVSKRQKTFGEVTVVCAFRGNSARPDFHYFYREPSKAEAKIKAFFDGLSERKARIKKRRAEDNVGHSFKVGDVVSNSWGYDQTNVDFYRVAKTTKNFVWLQPISGSISDEMEPPCSMAGYAQPSVDTSSPDMSKWSVTDLNKKLEKRKASGDSITMKYGSGSKWDGRPLYASWYA